MVTILEPPVDISVGPVSPPQELQPKPRALEWRYAMPFAGVKYYSFRPEPSLPKAELRDSQAEGSSAPKPLAVELIDERVILL